MLLRSGREAGRQGAGGMQESRSGRCVGAGLEGKGWVLTWPVLRCLALLVKTCCGCLREALGAYKSVLHHV